MERLPRLGKKHRRPVRRGRRRRPQKGPPRAAGPVLAVLLLAALACGAAHAGSAGAVRVKSGAVTVDWSRGYIEVQAEKTPAANAEIAKTAAVATAAAREKLATAAYGLPLDTFRRVRDLDGADRHLLAAIGRLVAGLPVYKQQYLSDGTVRIRLRMALTGAFAQLVLPAEIRHIESITTVKAARSAKGNAGPQPLSTGLVIDARGTGLQPALVPGILDEDGRQIYGEKYVSRESVVRWGMCRYFHDLQIARQSPRVAGRPLVIHGLRAAGPAKTSIVISNADAEKIRSASEVIALLRSCRVAVVID